MRRFLVGLTAIVFIFVLFGCTGAQKVPAGQQEPPGAQQHIPDKQQPIMDNPPPDQSEEAQPPETEAPKKEVLPAAYFFTSGNFLGSFDSQGWHSLCVINSDVNTSKHFSARELLAMPCYHVYSDKGFLGEADSIIWKTDEDYGLGSFEAAGAAEKFSHYGEVYYLGGDKQTKYRRFSLPTRLSNDFDDMKIPTYSFYNYFPYGENWTHERQGGTLVTNADGVNYLSDIKQSVPVTKEAEGALRKLFEEAAMGNTVSNFVQSFRGDFDQDGADEYIFAANTPHPEGSWPIVQGEGTKDDVGTFSALIFQDDDGSIQILHSDMRRFEQGPITFRDGYYNVNHIDYCHRLTLTHIADLNGDGRYEFIIEKILWEGGYDAVYSLNQQGQYEEVLLSMFGT